MLCLRDKCPAMTDCTERVYALKKISSKKSKCSQNINGVTKTDRNYNRVTKYLIKSLCYLIFNQIRRHCHYQLLVEELCNSANK